MKELNVPSGRVSPSDEHSAGFAGLPDERHPKTVTLLDTGISDRDIVLRLRQAGDEIARLREAVFAARAFIAVKFDGDPRAVEVGLLLRAALAEKT